MSQFEAGKPQQPSTDFWRKAQGINLTSGSTAITLWPGYYEVVTPGSTAILLLRPYLVNSPRINLGTGNQIVFTLSAPLLVQVQTGTSFLLDYYPEIRSKGGVTLVSIGASLGGGLWSLYLQVAAEWTICYSFGGEVAIPATQKFYGSFNLTVGAPGQIIPVAATAVFAFGILY